MKFKLRPLLVILILSLPLLAVEYDPKLEKARGHFKRGFKAFNQARFVEALKGYKDALDLAPDFTQAWYWIGKAYYKLGLMDQAILSWKRFLDLSGNNWELARKIKSIFFHEYKRDFRPSIYKHLNTITGAKWEKGRFYSPTSLVIDQKDNIYLIDTARMTILKFSPTGDFLKEWGKKELKRPWAIALDKEGNVYVSDFGDDSVKKFNSLGKVVLKIGGRGKEDGKFIGPGGLSVDGYGNIYVVDIGNARVQKFDKEGNFLMKFGKVGNYAGCFARPTDLLLDDNGDIWVVDSVNQRIQRFDSSGNFLAEFKPPVGPVELRGVTSDGESFFIADTKGRVFRFMPSLAQWETLKLEGRQVGIPVDVALNQNGLLYLVDFKNQSIEVFVPPEHLMTNFDVTVDRVITDHYPTVVYCVSVTGKGKIPILGLTANNFKILEKKKRMFPIVVQTPLQDRENLTAIFVVDISKQMAAYQSEIKRILFKFVEDMKPGTQAAGVICFADRVYEPQTPTLNKDRLTYAIGLLRYDKEFRSNSLPKAIYQGVTRTLNLFGKRVIILLASGERRQIKSPLMEEVLSYARNNYIQVMVIDFHEGEEVDEGLKRFADSTNGIYLLAHRSPLKLDNLYHEVLHLIRKQNQYMLFYKSPADEFSGKWVDGIVAAGYGKFYGEDLGGYFVP